MGRLLRWSPALREADGDAFQSDYFDLAAHQYPAAAVVDPPLHTALELERVLGALVKAPGRRVIDFGCGTGRLAVVLARAGYSVTGVDVSVRSLGVLAATARQLGLDGVETGTTLPRGPVHAVVGTDVLHHVDMDEHLPRIAAALVDGGRVVFSEPGALNPAWYAYLPLTHDMRVEKGIVSCTLPGLRRRFVRHGFRDVRVTGLGILPRPLLGWSRRACRLHDAAGALPVVRWFAYRYIIEARI